MTDTECKVCKLIRTYVLVAVPLVLILGAQALNKDASIQSWVPGVVLIDLLAYGALGALVAIVESALKRIHRYQKKRKKLNQVRRRLEEEGAAKKDDR